MNETNISNSNNLFKITISIDVSQIDVHVSQILPHTKICITSHYQNNRHKHVFVEKESYNFFSESYYLFIYIEPVRVE